MWRRGRSRRLIARFTGLLRDGVDVECPRTDGLIKTAKARLVHFEDVQGSDWLVVNQFTVIEAEAHTTGGPTWWFS